MKNGRWVKIHEQDQTNFETKNNVLDIVAGSPRCQAEATFTGNTRTFAKAAYWLVRYLGHADAQQLLILAAEEIQAKAVEAMKDDERMEAVGEGWDCTIEKIEAGVFKVLMTWTPDVQPVEVEIAAKKRSRKTDEAQPVEEIGYVPPVEEIAEVQPVEPPSKKRGRKKSNEAKGLLSLFPSVCATDTCEA